MGQVYDIVRRDYADKPDDTKLIESAINGMVSGLDPHSNYMDANNFRDMQTQTSGQFGGLGMQVTMKDGLVKVIAPLDDTPASRANIGAGDVISKVDGQPVAGLDLEQVVTKLRGPQGSSVAIEITRQNEAQPPVKTLKREIIKARSVHERVDGDDVGYIQLTEFNGLAGDELKEAINHISSSVPADRLKGYILDLRNNPGGLLNQADAVSEVFLGKGEEIVSPGDATPRRISVITQNPATSSTANR